MLKADPIARHDASKHRLRQRPIDGQIRHLKWIEPDFARDRDVGERAAGHEPPDATAGRAEDCRDFGYAEGGSGYLHRAPANADLGHAGPLARRQPGIPRPAG